MQVDKKNKILKIIDIAAVVIMAFLFFVNLVAGKELIITTNVMCIIHGIAAVYFAITYFFNTSKLRLVCGIYCWIQVIRYIN